jgi:hypothetical protein
MSVSVTSVRAPHKKNRPVPLNRGLDHKLLAYAAAASAAGVAAISLAQPCQAEIIFTKAHQSIDANSSYSLDLNNDGVVDFSISNRSNYCQTARGRSLTWCRSQNLWINAAGTNKFVGVLGGNGACSGECADALSVGQIVGSGDTFIGSGRMDKCVATRLNTSNASGDYLSGSWVSVPHKYLGFAFSIDGQTHYGWARLTSHVKIEKKRCKSNVVLTGYAYETIPGKSIVAGKVQGKDEDEIDEADEPAPTLGRLALGHVESEGQAREDKK